MFSTTLRTWQDEVRNTMSVDFKMTRARLVKERDKLLRLSNTAQISVVNLSDKRNARYRKACHYATMLTQQLNRARDACNELLNEDEVIAAWQDRLVLAVDWYMSGVYIHTWRDSRFVLRSNREEDCLHIYFGGTDEPDGLQHGHLVLLSDGRTAYRRNPSDKRGPRNIRIARTMY